MMRRALMASVVVGLLNAASLAAWAQPAEPRITEPSSQTVVAEGDTIRVQGDGCDPGGEVTFDIGREHHAGRTTADDDGSFDAQVTIPDVPTSPPGTPEPDEWFFGVVCGGERGGIVLAIQQAELAYTGTPSHPSVIAALTAVIAGYVLVFGARRRDARSGS